MVVKATGEGLDWLQRLQAAWTAVPESWKTSIKSGLWWLGVTVGGIVIGKVKNANVQPVEGYFYSVGAGAIAAVGYAVYHRVRTPNKPPPPPPTKTSIKTLQLFTHIHAGAHIAVDPLLVQRVFQIAGWSVESGPTGVDIHSEGVWVHGGNDESRTEALQRLRTIGIEARIDNRAADLPQQIIIGRKLGTDSTSNETRPSQPVPELTLKWGRRNCTLLHVENRRIQTANNTKVIVNAIYRQSESLGEFYEVDIPTGQLPGILTGGSTEVKHEPESPVMFNFVAYEGPPGMLRIQLQDLDGSNLRSLPLRQAGKFRAHISLTWGQEQRYDCLAVFDWHHRGNVPLAVGEIADWPTQ